MSNITNRGSNTVTNITLTTRTDAENELLTIIERAGFTEAMFHTDLILENGYTNTGNGFVRVNDDEFVNIVNVSARNYYRAEVGVNAHEDGFTLGVEVTPAGDHERIDDFEVNVRDADDANRVLTEAFDDIGMDMDEPLTDEALAEDLYLVLLTVQVSPKIAAHHLNGLSPSADT